MITPRLTHCPECPNFLSLIKDIDCKLMGVSNDLYNNTIFLLNREIDSEVIIDLINYKRILTHKICNIDYNSIYTPIMIASRVKLLTHGAICVDCDEMVRTSTSSTTAELTTTTTTTAAPTTTSTTTAIAYSTTTTTTTALVNSCDSPVTFPGGQDYPNTSYVYLGVILGTVTFSFDTISIPDKFEVWFDGVKVIDTGYRGFVGHQTNLNNALIALGEPTEPIVGPAEGSTSFYKGSAVDIAEIRVWAPMTGTYWTYTMSCPDGVTTTSTSTTVAPTTTTTTT